MPATLFFGAPASGQQPFVYESQNQIAPQTTPPVGQMNFVGIFKTAPTKPIQSGPFTIALPTSTVPYYQLTAAGSDVTTFDNTPIRAKLRADVIAFLTLLEPLLIPGAINVVRRSLAQALPLTFAETLYYRHGLDGNNRYVDLQPGMRLRVEFQAHQAIDPSSQNNAATGYDARNGFLGAGTSLIDVVEIAASNGTLLIGFDGFLSSLTTLAVAPNTGGAAGAIDLQGSAFAYPHVRLFYPAKVPASDTMGSISLTDNVVLYGAGSIADLEAATTSYLANGTFGGQGTAAFFRGRTMVIPEIAILLPGGPDHVPLGTTFRDVLRRYMPLPRMNTAVCTVQWLSSQWLLRPQYILNPGGISLPPAWQPGANASIQSYQYYSPALDSFDLPMLGGDSITTLTAQ